MVEIYGSREEFTSKLKEFMEAIGNAMVRWQELEEAHFKLFYGLLGAPENHEIAAVIYYHTESFAARHVLVNNMLTLVLGTSRDHKVLRSDWSNNTGGLYKEIKDANENRNKLAHYRMNFEMKALKGANGYVEKRPHDPRLQPSAYNVRTRLIGATPDKPDHNLSAADITRYTKAFFGLVGKINKFHDRIPMPPGANPTAAHGLPHSEILRFRQQIRSAGK